MQSPTSSSFSASPLDEQSRLTFQRMSRQVGRLVKSASPDNVHKFRTNSRRIEALVSETAPEDGAPKKLLKLLSKLRKKAGKVRDLDVQIAFLKELRVPDRLNQKAQLLEAMEAEQARRKKKLARAFDASTASDLRKRLRRVQSEMHLNGIDLLQLAQQRLPDPGTAPITEKMLHACRIQAKRARYLAEIAPESLERTHFIEELKRAQDAVGEWHDTLKLKVRAEKLFGGVNDSSLVAVLQNVSRAKFRRATSALIGAVAALSTTKKTPTAAPQVNRPAQAGDRAAA